MHAWGRHPVVSGETYRARVRSDIDGMARQSAPSIAQGNRRSYGDACLYDRVLSMRGLDRIIDFDPESGVIEVEAGLTIGQLVRHVLPTGWFPWVTPGTMHATIGGCVAADVHGKNHHRDGSFGRHVESLDLVLAGGETVRCSREHRPELLWATVGGMGLTGFIAAVRVRLRAVAGAVIERRSRRVADLDDCCDLLEGEAGAATYAVAWLDALARGARLGRGVVTTGEHAAAPAAPGNAFAATSANESSALLSLVPSAVLNRASVKLFNAACYHRPRRDQLVPIETFFYPLDAIGEWNRLYGKRGFVQYQIMVPFDGGRAVVREVIERVERGTAGPFLAVIKTLGPEGEGILSFPAAGWTLCLDIPMDRRVPGVIAALDRVVADAGGRVYLAKDALLDGARFRSMYSRVGDFLQIKRQVDPDCRLRSAQSDRLGITPYTRD